MNKELNIGDYCYIKGVSRDYGIGKITQLNSGYSSNGGELIDIQFKHSKHSVPKKDVISSHNILDLIEEHDILKIEEQKGIYKICEVEKFKECYTNYEFLGVRLENQPVARKLYELNIISILTKEQFESMKYEVK